ncbi:MAG TPA: GtrA family protein [Steroidobacteraceae bacterium]
MRALRFGVVGVVNTAVDFSIYSALTLAAGVLPAIANILSYSCGIGVSFWLNRAWTFRDRNTGHLSTQLLLFLGGNLVGLALSTLVVAWLARDWGPLPAKVASIGASFAWNFAFSNLVVFGKRAARYG